MRKLIIGSRRSKLALTQTRWVIDQLKKAGAPFEFEIKEIVTKGDQILNVTLSKVGGKGLFVKEIEQAMMDKEIDFAVHSMKDMPSVLPEGLELACTPPREDDRDALISENHVPFEKLPDGAIVGTSSLRRGAQLLAKRPDLSIKWIRGNIDTRLAKLQNEDYDAIVLAAAGLKRMGWSDDVVTQYLEKDVCIPAVGQGSLAIECRESDQELKDWLEKINCPDTFDTVRAERAFLRTLEGGCQVPIGGLAELAHDSRTITLTGFVSTPDGKTIIKDTIQGTNPEEIGIELANRLSERGAKDILDRVKKELDQ
ncbi:hydroxymethylbilane synthase [Pseudalkalibacillus salsuginis]|uniref:hydroxymethylbilane synthase n=1 Tax=Pseudalkalibacillus salsuginis TaxID=2910972 RepID=UPI001F031AAC|nr:hydroxymethylbilane synthase [Pseudalkalibacillus salsuginis]MCF6408678.1 hydroxymethylbilane synthase [Pseudalkalibacillus salsuginis]